MLLVASISDVNSCSYIDSLYFNILPEVRATQISSVDTVCNEEEITLFANQGYVASNLMWQKKVNGVWQDELVSNDTLVIVPESGDVFRLKFQNGNCEEFSNEVEPFVLEHGNYQFEILVEGNNPDTLNLCQGTEVILNVEAIQGNGKLQYLWEGTEIENIDVLTVKYIADTLENNFVTMKIEDNFGCSGSDTVVFDVDRQAESGQISSSHDFIACGDDDYELIANGGFGERDWQVYNSLFRTWESLNVSDSNLVRAASETYHKYRVVYTNGECEVISDEYSQLTSKNSIPLVNITYNGSNAGDTLEFCGDFELNFDYQGQGSTKLLNSWDIQNAEIIGRTTQKDVLIKPKLNNNSKLILEVNINFF